MSCSESIARLLLIIINFVFLLLGVGLIVVGCLTQWGSHIISQHIRPLLDKVSSGALDNVNLQTLFQGVAITLIIVGVVVFVIGLLGFIGALCKHKLMLLVYGIVVLLIIVAEIVVISLAAAMYAKAETTLKNGLKDVLTNNYKGRNNTNEAVTAAWNFVFVELKCCGVDNYQDVQSSTKWDRNVTINNVDYYLKAPLSCCKNVKGTFPDYTFANGTCGAYPDTENSNFESGCFDAVKNLIQSNAGIVIGVGVGIAVIEIFCVVAAFCLYRQWKKEGVV